MSITDKTGIVKHIPKTVIVPMLDICKTPRYLLYASRSAGVPGQKTYAAGHKVSKLRKSGNGLGAGLCVIAGDHQYQQRGNPDNCYDNHLLSKTLTG